jgi:hypothetical protein
VWVVPNGFESSSNRAWINHNCIIASVVRVIGIVGGIRFISVVGGIRLISIVLVITGIRVCSCGECEIFELKVLLAAPARTSSML